MLKQYILNSASLDLDLSVGNGKLNITEQLSETSILKIFFITPIIFLVLVQSKTTYSFKSNWSCWAFPGGPLVKSPDILYDVVKKKKKHNKKQSDWSCMVCIFFGSNLILYYRNTIPTFLKSDTWAPFSFHPHPQFSTMSNPHCFSSGSLQQPPFWCPCLRSFPPLVHYPHCSPVMLSKYKSKHITTLLLKSWPKFSIILSIKSNFLTVTLPSCSCWTLFLRK